MKHLLPVLIFLLLVVSVFALFKYKSNSATNAPMGAQQISTIEKIPTGDPDDTVDEIVRSAQEEADGSSGEDEELADVNADLTEVSSLGDVYSENEY